MSPTARGEGKPLKAAICAKKHKFLDMASKSPPKSAGAVSPNQRACGALRDVECRHQLQRKTPNSDPNFWECALQIFRAENLTLNMSDVRKKSALFAPAFRALSSHP